MAVQLQDMRRDRDRDRDLMEGMKVMLEKQADFMEGMKVAAEQHQQQENVQSAANGETKTKAKKSMFRSRRIDHA
jgi:hypothetical protein